MKKVAVVVPCYRVSTHILGVLSEIGEEVQHIIVVDDACPERTRTIVSSQSEDPRVVVISHKDNIGVGGATKTGFLKALEFNADIVVKVDGDGQIDPKQIPIIIGPLLSQNADYVKGNRFFYPEGLAGMPVIRLVGNAVLSFMTKLSTGYWNIFDPTNGFFAIDAKVLANLPIQKIDDRYFFESDMLFRLGLLRAKVVDAPMAACYGDEKSNLNIAKIIPEFFGKHVRNFFKRFFYNYILRDFNLGSVGFLVGLPLIAFGVVFGVLKWVESIATGIFVTSGTVMLAALPVIVGVQLMLVFLNVDIASVPITQISSSLSLKSEQAE